MRKRKEIPEMTDVALAECIKQRMTVRGMAIKFHVSMATVQEHLDKMVIVPDEPNQQSESIDENPAKIVEVDDDIIADLPLKDAIHPDYYKGKDGHDVIWLAMNWGLDPLQFNAIKYIIRAGRKDADKAFEDIDKGIECLSRRKEFMEV